MNKKNLSNDSASEKFTNDIAENQSQPDSTGEPQVYAMGQDVGSLTFTRRDFLAAAGALAGAAALAGCAVVPTPTPTSTPTRRPTRTPRPTSTQTPTPTQEPTPVLNLQQACQSIKAHKGWVIALALSPAGRLLASSGVDDAIKLWALPEWTLLKTLDGVAKNSHTLAISPDGKLLVSGSDEAFQIWSLTDGALKHTLQENTSPGTLAISPDGKLLAAGCYSGGQYVIKLWSLPSGSLLKTLEEYQGNIESLAISPDGKLLVSGGRETINFWSLPGGGLLKTIVKGVYTSVSALAISPDGTRLASGSFGELHPTGSSSATLSLWSLPDGALLKTPEGYTDHIDQLWISPDGKTLVSGYDEKLVFWSLPDLELLRTLELPADMVNVMTISPDGELVALGQYDGAVKLWSLPDGEFTSCLMDLAANEKDVKGVTYQQPGPSGVVEYTLPCGSPIPAGAACTCNCVAGSLKPPTGGGLHYWYPN